MKILVPGLPPTTNSAFIQRGRFRVLAPKARQWKEDTKALLEAMDLRAPAGFLEVSIHFHSPKWICKNGNVRKADCANVEKLLVDCLFEVLGVDDSMIWKMTLEKVMDKTEWTEIEVKELAGQ